MLPAVVFWNDWATGEDTSRSFFAPLGPMMGWLLSASRWGRRTPVADSHFPSGETSTAVLAFTAADDRSASAPGVSDAKFVMPAFRAKQAARIFRFL